MSYNTQNIKLLENELWWGGLVEDGIHMPYGLKNIEHDLIHLTTSNQAMPLLISNKGRYVWASSGMKYSFVDDMLHITSNGDVEYSEGYKDLYNVYQHVSNKYFPTDNNVPYKRLFTHPQYNTWIELMYDQEEDAILEYAQKILDNNMPTGVLMIDDNWQEDYGVWEFSTKRFKNPKEMVEKLHNMGFDIMLWVCPFVSADSSLFRWLEKKDYLVKNSDGSTAIRHWWNGYSAVLDMTNPNTTKWFDERLQYLMDEYSIDGFKFDAGDTAFYKDDDIIYKPCTANEHCKAFNEFGVKYSLNEFRCAWDAAGLGLAQRLSDKCHSWDVSGLNTLIPNGLAQGMMGYKFTCPDMIGGGEFQNFIARSKGLDQELVVRYAQCSALFPMMQFSVAPWRILSDEYCSYCIDAANLHLKLGEHIYALTQKAATENTPIIYHLAHLYPDGEYEEINDQFMLGEDILVAPVIEKGARSRTVHFPEGVWIGDDQSTIKGPCTVNIDVPLSRLPWYKKQS